jgi:hypothetical protein
MRPLDEKGPSVQVTFRLPFGAIAPIHEAARAKNLSFSLAAREFTIRGLRAAGIDV